jgi:DNA-nicking Smr family endonuclease
MARPLSPDEAALWGRVTAHIAAEAARPRVRLVERLHPEPLPARKATPVGTTLDASWDRRLERGEVMPDRTIDLHELTLDRAHAHLLRALEASVRHGHRLVVLVTGKAPQAGANRLDAPLRGIIRASVGDWLEASPLAPHIAAVRPAHTKHGGAGALYIVLRRARA